MNTLTTCRYCEASIAWVKRATTGRDVPLDTVRVPTATANPSVDVFVARRDGTAVLVTDLVAPPFFGYTRHRCPQWSEAVAAAADPCRSIEADVREYLDAMPPQVPVPAADRRLWAV